MPRRHNENKRKITLRIDEQLHEGIRIVKEGRNEQPGGGYHSDSSVVEDALRIYLAQVLPVPRQPQRKPNRTAAGKKKARQRSRAA